MSSYFFDTNLLFKSFFNSIYFTESYLKDYFTCDCTRFISKHVEYEFSRILLDFSNQFGQFLLEPYFKLNTTKGKITLEKFQKMCEDTESIRFNSQIISSMIWETVNPKNIPIDNKSLQNQLDKFIYEYNNYFYYKYLDLTGRFEIYNRLEKYEDIAGILNGDIHKADLNICLDAHDICMRKNIDDMIILTSDKIFERKRELILKETAISDIIIIK